MNQNPLSPPTHVPSESDSRTVNNLMRHQYRVLSPVEKQRMIDIKDAGLRFVELLHEVGGTTAEFEAKGDQARQSSRELSIAQTDIETAVMWATKHITR